MQLALAYEPEERAKRRGMARAASAAGRDLQIARSIALELGTDGREVWADLVRFECERRPELGITWGNWAGSIFSGRGWRFVRFTRSTAPGSHANLLRTWRLEQ